jgi:hypothetical protein
MYILSIKMNLADSNLYQLFSSLSPDELKDLDKALHSPFFNYREGEIKLFEYLLKIKKAKPELISAESAFKYVFPKQKRDIAKLRHVMTYLTRIIYRYITIHEMEEAEEYKKLLLTRAMRKRNLTKLFLSNYTDTKNYYDDHAQLSPDLYYHQFQIDTEYYIYSITNRRAKNEELQQLSEDLDSFYIIQKLKHACSILSYKNIFQFEHQDELIDETMAMVAKKKLLQNPLVNILYHNYLCLSEPENEDYFTQLKRLLLTTSERIDVRELRDIFTLAINYCIKRLNTGGQKYYVEVFDIYEAGLARGVFEDRGQLSAFTYKNISAIAIGLKKYSWVATFLDQYKGKLDPLVRDGFYAYCMARYFFATGRYAEVTDLLRQVDIREQFTDLDARVLLIKTYYELEEFNLLEYSIDNLKQQLQRKNLQSYHQSVYGNFVRSVSKLIHLRPYDKKARTIFREKLSATSAVAEKEWLLSKV